MRAIVLLCVLIAIGSATFVAVPKQSAEEAAAIQNLEAKLSCGDCELFAGLLVSFVNNTASFDRAIAEGEKLCEEKLSDKIEQDICKEVVKLGGKALTALLKGAESLAWNIPKTVCSDIIKVCKSPCCFNPNTPEQLHLSFADSDPQLVDGKLNMRVTWVTLNNISQEVQYGIVGGQSAPFVAKATQRTYTVGGWIGTIHTAVMSGLNPNATYAYNVGSSSFGFSKMYNFTTPPANIGSAERPLRAVLIADMGYGPHSTHTINRIADRVDAGEVDVVLHVGDISYADADESHWDLFWRKVEPIAARVPYMTSPGNHELYWNFTAYRARSGLSMPESGNGLEGAQYYALNLGTLSALMMDSETWADTADINGAQQQWVSEKLNAANAVRKQRPWVWALHHRPLYCTSGGSLDCDFFTALLRSQVEQKYYKNKVDVAYAGHMHNWERMYPTYEGNVMSKNYTQPPAPVYIVNGAAGNREGMPRPRRNHPWSAFGDNVVGYSTFVASSDFSANQHTLDVTFYESYGDTVVDHIKIEKNL